MHRGDRRRTDDICEALAAVLAALEAEEALERAEEAVLCSVGSLVSCGALAVERQRH